MKKTVCPVSRARFLENAVPVGFILRTQANEVLSSAQLSPKEFSTGSFGYYTNGKVTLDIGGTPVVFQANVTLTAVGSKEVQ